MDQLKKASVQFSSKQLLLALLIINILDIILHVATNNIEFLRISGNVIVTIGTLISLLAPISRKINAMIVASVGLASLVLNIVHIIEFGIGVLGIIFIAATTYLALHASYLLRDARQ